MPLVQMIIDSREYYADDKIYYTFHRVQAATDTLWDFACLDLGITDTEYQEKRAKIMAEL